MSHQPGRLLTRGESRKRKERDVLPMSVTTASTSFNTQEPVSSNNKLLAGYLAYEFLSKGTLFGQKFELVRAVAEPLSISGSTEPKRLRLGESRGGEAEPRGRVKPEKESYAEVASLLKSDGAHIGGLINPTQLARWIQM